MGRIDPGSHTVEEVVRLLGLEPLEHEGGWFRRVAEARGGGAGAWSAIVALLSPEGFSALHRLTKDEVWSFLAGDRLESLRLHPDGRVEEVALGLDAAAGERVVDVVRAGVWQGTSLARGGRWALVSCIVVPEFAWADFELAERRVLEALHPSAARRIAELVR